MDAISRKAYPLAQPFKRELLFPQLLRRSPLLPGESLPSLLARLTVLNGYESLKVIRWLAGEDWYNRRRTLATGAEGDVGEGRVMDDPARPEEPATYARLSILTGLSTIELYRASAHILTIPTAQEHRSITLPGGGSEHVLPLLPSHTPPVLRDTNDAHYCPLCLQGEPYHKLVWLSKACVACLEHKVLLVKGCHACGAKVSVLDAVKAQCGRCDASLCNAPALDISADQVGLVSQHLIQAGVLGQPVDDRLRLRYGTPNEPPAALYRFLHGLTINVARKVHKLDKPWTYLHSIAEEVVTGGDHTLVWDADLKQLYALYTTAAKALLQWPTGFHAFLDEYRTARGKPRIDNSTLIVADLDALYTTWLNWHWQQPEFSFVRRAFDQYLLDRQAQTPSLTNTARYQKDPTFVSGVKHVSLKMAMEVLHLPRFEVHKLASEGWLTSDRVSTCSKRSYLLVDRDHLQEVAHRWLDAIPLAGAAHCLGLPGSTVIHLAESGFLPALSGPVIDECPLWMFHKDEVERCLQRTMNKAIAVRGWGSRMLLLHKAARLYMPVPASLPMARAELVRKVADGTLQAYVSTATTSAGVRRIDSLLFAAGDIAKLCPQRPRGRAKRVSC